MQIAVSISQDFSSADDFVAFAAKVRELFASITSTVVTNSGTGKREKVSEPLKRVAEYTVEPRDVQPVTVEPVDAIEAAPVERTAEAVQQPVPEHAGEAKKRVRRTRDQIAADKAADEAAKAAAKVEPAMPAAVEAPAETAARMVRDKFAASDAPAVTLGDLRGLMGEVVECDNGEMEFAKLITRHGATKLSLLKPETYAAVAADIKATIARLNGKPAKPDLSHLM